MRLTIIALCIALALIAPLTLMYIGVSGALDEGASIGGTSVPSIACEEDEVISWVGIDSLGCVHFENIN